MEEVAECSDPQVGEVAVDGADPHEVDWYGFDTENDENGVVTETALISESGAPTVWTKAGPFGEWCEKRMNSKKPAVIICHNLEYDLVNEFGPKKYAEFGLNYLKGRLISAKIGCIKFQDSFNHFRMTLLDIGKALGIQKKEMDIHSPEYVATDAWICLQAMTQARDYIASLGGKIGATSGSSAMSVWSYMTDQEFFTGPHDTPWMRKGYYGGRTEIFRRNSAGNPDGFGYDFQDERVIERLYLDKAVRAYDINSMYPYCMLNEFPEYFMDDSPMNKGKGMAEITVSVPHDLFVAPLCHRSINDQLLYPVGVFRGVWTYDEIRQAEKMGAKVLQVHKAIGGNSMVRPFDQFIMTLYAKRKASKSEAERLFLKVLMNALYGKIASRNQVTRTVSRYSLLKTGSKRIEEVKWITYHRGLLDYFTPQQPYVNVLWGAMITAYARNLTMDYMLKVPNPEDKLAYCDTDCVWTLGHEFPVSNELGALKLEKADESCYIPQPKAYRFGDFYRAKGVPRPREGKGGIIIDHARQYVEQGFTEFQAPIRFRASLNSHKGVANQWVRHQKSRKSPYSAKRLSGEVYYPPCIGHQLELGVAKRSYKPKAQLTLGI